LRRPEGRPRDGGGRRRLALAAALALLGSSLGAVPAARGAVTAVTAPTKTVRAGKLTIGYRSIGHGRPVVMIMGLAGAMDAWQPTFLDALARQGHRVIVFDNEGIGRTKARPGTLTIRRMGDDTAALITALHLGRPDVMGWSMGGMIAQSLAVRHPRSLRRLVLMATSPGDGVFAPPRPDALALLTASPPNPLALLNELFPPHQTAARNRYIADVGRRQPLSTIAPPAVIARQLAASVAWSAGEDPDGARVHDLDLPVLVGGGALDHLLPVANQRHLGNVIPHARLVVYPDAAHGFLFQRMRPFLRRVDAFLTPRGAGSTR